MAYLQPTMRKTRFVCVSDTHNAVPGGAFKLPRGDVLLHAGDMTNQGSYSELQKTVKWLEEADFEAKIVIAGNHDITLDSDFYSLHGSTFHNQDVQDPSACQQLLENSPSILWLKHGSAVVDLQSPAGPRTTFKIFGSPYSPAKGTWAFGYEVNQATHTWEEIPADADIVMTHTPPMHRCDKARDGQPAGCPALCEALGRVQPRLAVCGHIHEGRGVEYVRWDGGEESIKRWEDPGNDNKKVSLVDLTTRRDDAVHDTGLVFHGGETHADSPEIPGPVVVPESLGRLDSKAKYKAVPNPFPSPAAHGPGRSLHGGLRFQETCIVNAAIMASSWPHGPGRKRFNKPIVVDIDLPTWQK